MALRQLSAQAAARAAEPDEGGWLQVAHDGRIVVCDEPSSFSVPGLSVRCHGLCGGPRTHEAWHAPPVHLGGDFRGYSQIHLAI